MRKEICSTGRHAEYISYLLVETGIACDRVDMTNPLFLSVIPAIF